MTVVSSRYLLRPMTLVDIPRVSQIEQESFPTMWPQTAYKRELQRNNLAAYIVVSALPAPEGQADLPEIAISAEAAEPRGRFGRLSAWLRSLLVTNAAGAPPIRTANELIVGFIGVWFMVDEAHVVTLAVAESERRKGLGELLLIAGIELAQCREQEVMTLECRVSNVAAQALYEKYGFQRVGVRKRYYTDNNEDALIMTTPELASTDYQARFERLRAEHRARHGTPVIAHPDL